MKRFSGRSLRRDFNWRVVGGPRLQCNEIKLPVLVGLLVKAETLGRTLQSRRKANDEPPKELSKSAAGCTGKGASHILYGHFKELLRKPLLHLKAEVFTPNEPGYSHQRDLV